MEWSTACREDDLAALVYSCHSNLLYQAETTSSSSESSELSTEIYLSSPSLPLPPSIKLTSLSFVSGRTHLQRNRQVTEPPNTLVTQNRWSCIPLPPTPIIIAFSERLVQAWFSSHWSG